MHLDQRLGVYSRNQGETALGNLEKHNLTIKQGSKASRKPQPLTFDYNAGRTLDHEHQTSGSIALHDAAVQSATNLMAVVNDM